MEKKFKEVTGIDFTQFYKEQKTKLLYFVQRRTGHDDDICYKLVNDTFLKFLTEIDNYDPKKSSPATWLHNTANLMCMTHWTINKNKPKTTDVDEEFNISYQETPDENILEKEKLIKLLNNWDKWQEDLKHKEPFLLRVIEGLTYDEISERLGMKLSDVKNHILMTRRKLIKLMTQDSNPTHLE